MSRVLAAAVLALLVPLVAGSGPGPGPVATPAAPDLAARGLRSAAIVDLSIDARPDGAMTVAVPLNGTAQTIELAPHSVRSAGFQVLVQHAGGTVVPAPAGPVRTLRGRVLDDPGSLVAGSLLPDGLHASVRLSDGALYWIEPLGAAHAVYRSEDVAETPGACGIDHAARPAQLARDDAAVPAGAGTPCAVELAVDADVEFFNHYGSVEAVQDRVETVINVVNAQYEIQLSIAHALSTILVRTAEPDPYEPTYVPGVLLCQFITEWTTHQAAVPRDVAVLFTGRPTGSVIGMAADIGDTGICTPEGACEGGTYGQYGSYCFARTEFNGNFGCATDLVAHELGHLWGAYHCSCPGSTMRPTIACANSFSQGSIESISAYRDTRPCLDGACDGMGCCRADGHCVPDDCNGNHIADLCDIAQGTSLDCNANDVPDGCEIAAGSAADCNANGIPDECDVSAPVEFASGPMSPIGAGAPQTFTIVAPPAATANVIVRADAFGEFDGWTHALSVKLNGQSLGAFMGITADSGDCVVSTDALVVPAETFNALVAGGDAAFTFETGALVDPDHCDDPSYLSVTVAIGRPSALDGNGNGELDTCECATDVTGPDGAADGWVDDLDLERLLSEWGSPCAGACTADVTGPDGPDGNVDALDLLAMLAEWGGPGCP